MRKLRCLRCGCAMEYLMCEKFQKGDMGVWVGNLNFSMQGGFEMEVYNCPNCGKLEFFQPGVPEEEVEIPDMGDDFTPPALDRTIVSVSREGIPQVRCPACGAKHDFDYPKCPKCGHSH